MVAVVLEEGSLLRLGEGGRGESKREGKEQEVNGRSVCCKISVLRPLRKIESLKVERRVFFLFFSSFFLELIYTFFLKKKKK